MGVDAKWGRFPICPEMSRCVPVCPLLSQFVPVPGPKKDKRGQTGTKTGHFGTNWETPPFSIYPHFALLKLFLTLSDDFCRFFALGEKCRKMYCRGFSSVPWHKRAFGPCTKQVFFEVFLGIPRALCKGKGAPWYGTSARPESHFTCSSPRCAPGMVPSTFLLNCFWAFLGGLGRGEGRPWYGTFAKPKGHFTEGMFEKC